MLPSHSLFERFPQTFDFRWPTTGEVIAVEWMRDNGDVFFRPCDADVSMIWHALDIFEKKTPEVVLDEALQIEQLRRVLPWGENEFVYWNPQEGIVHRLGNDVGGAFRWPSALRWSSDWRWLWGADDELTSYLHLEVSPPTEFQRAQRFAENYMRGWAGIEVSNGSPRMLYEILQTVFCVYGVEFERIRIYPPDSYFKYRRDGQLTLRRYEGVPPRLLKTITRWFAPTECDRKRVRGFSAWHKTGSEFLPHIESRPCTMHERMEALFSLRDFLRDKLSPEEIESILPR